MLLSVIGARFLQKGATSRTCSLKVNGVDAGKNEFKGVSGDIYNNDGGTFGNVWGWRFIGTLGEIKVCPQASGCYVKDVNANKAYRSNVNIAHDSTLLSPLNKHSFRLTVNTKPSSDRYPRSYVPLYFSTNPTRPVLAVPRP